MLVLLRVVVLVEWVGALVVEVLIVVVLVGVVEVLLC